VPILAAADDSGVPRHDCSGGLRDLCKRVAANVGRGFCGQLQGFQFARSVGRAFHHRAAFFRDGCLDRRGGGGLAAEAFCIRAHCGDCGGIYVGLAILLLAIQTEEKRVVLLGLVVSGFFMSWYHGPATAVMHDMMPRRAHATSIGIYMLVTQLVGGFGPQVVGRISDLRDLQLGLQICVAVMVGGALLMLLVIHFIRRDGLRHPSLEVFHVESAD
jgi:MFS family permease